MAPRLANMSAGVRNALGLGLSRGGAAPTQQVRGYCQSQATAIQHHAIDHTDLCSFGGGALFGFVVLRWWLKPVVEDITSVLKAREELAARSTEANTKK